MSEPLFNHPSSEDLAAFVDGKLVDAREIEAHLDGCVECATIVVIARQSNHIPAEREIEAASDAGQRERFRAFVKGQSLPRKGGEQSVVTKESRPSQGKISPIWMALGGLAGVYGVGHAAAGPKPMLAGYHPADSADSGHHPVHDHHPAEDTDHAESASNPENSEHSDVMPDEESASHNDAGHWSVSNAVTEFLERVEEILGFDGLFSHDAGHDTFGTPIDDAGSVAGHELESPGDSASEIHAADAFAPHDFDSNDANVHSSDSADHEADHLHDDHHTGHDGHHDEGHHESGSHHH